MDSAAILLGFALYAATIVAIHRWISAIPARVAVLLKAEREVDQKDALDALQAATGARVAQIVSSLCKHEEQSAAVHRAREAAADTRARVAEGRAGAAARREAEVVTALEAATALVTQLRGFLDHAGAAPHPTDEPADPQERRTVEMKPGALPQAVAGDDDEPEEEKTQVAKRPALDPATSSGLRLAKPAGRGAAS